MDQTTPQMCHQPTSVRLTVEQDAFLREMVIERQWSIAQCVGYCIDYLIRTRKEHAARGLRRRIPNDPFVDRSTRKETSK